MEVNARALKAEMIRRGKTTNDLVAYTGISKSSFYRKLKGKTEFSRGDILKISNYLQLSKEEWLEIFFNEKVS